MLTPRIFGEEESKPCGVCDVCLEQKKGALQEQRFEQIQNAIRDKLAAGPLSMYNLAKLFPASQKEDVLSVMEYLLDEEFMTESEGMLYWKT